MFYVTAIITLSIATTVNTVRTTTTVPIFTNITYFTYITTVTLTRMSLFTNKKLDGVAPLIAIPPPDNSTTMHSRLVCQNRNVCFAVQPICPV